MTAMKVGVDDLEVSAFKDLLTPVTHDEEDTGCALR
jgi:hypothetical protein